MQEMVINFRDLFLRVCLKWRSILVGMLIGAILFDGIGIMRSYQYSKSVEEYILNGGAENEILSEIKSLEENLSKREIEDVEMSVNNWLVNNEYYKKVLEYSNNSIKMKINPNCVSTLSVQYFIDNHFEVAYPVVNKKDVTLDIVTTYIVKVYSANIYERIKKTLGWEVESEYIQELISAESYGDTSSFRITIISYDEESCEIIYGIIEEMIEDVTDELQKIYGDFDIIQTNKQYSERVDTSLLTAQQNEATELNSLRYTISNITTGMTEGQRKLYYALLDREGIVDETSETKTEMNTVPQVDIINFKYIILGAVLFAFIICVYVMLSYIFSATLRVKEDIEGVYGIPLLGNILYEKKPKKRMFWVIDRIIYLFFSKTQQGFSEEERIKMICAGIKISVQKSKMKKIYITSTCNDNSVRKLMETLYNRLQSDVEMISYGKSILYDPESLEALSTCDGVVLLEQIDRSFYDEIKKEVELCNKHEVNIIGSVIIR